MAKKVMVSIGAEQFIRAVEGLTEAVKNLTEKIVQLEKATITVRIAEKKTAIDEIVERLRQRSADEIKR
jgi:prefoldin subunit 5